jgi:exodeoxyribonuclease VII small subunit
MATTKKTAAAPSRNFEQAMSALEAIVRELERGDQPLEDSLKLFEEGVKLSRECQERLRQAERRIELLLRDDQGAPVVTEFAGADEPANESTSGLGDDETLF